MGHALYEPCFGWHSLVGCRTAHLRENAYLSSRSNLGEMSQMGHNLPVATVETEQRGNWK